MYYLIPFYLLILVTACKEDTAVKPLNKSLAERTVIEQRFEATVDSLLPLVETFTTKNNYNTQIAFIADLSIHSGLPRFAVVDIETKKMLVKDVVAHGSGTGDFAREAVFSNIPNSLRSSKGKYKIGVKYKGNMGTAYKLHGLSPTNSKAYERFVVLHAWDCVQDEAPYPDYLCNSQGCPMVSYKFLKTLSNYIDKSKKPILLWIVGGSK